MSAPDPRLEALYQATAYEVDAPGGGFALQIGERSAAAEALLAQHGARCAAFLTAWNPRSRPLAVAENRARQEHLLRTLAAARRRFFPGRGRGPDPAWTPEESALVLDLEEPEALALARIFDQAALVHLRLGETARLLWC